MEQDEARKLLDYDPETGVLTWKVALSNRVKVGQEAGGPYKSGDGKWYHRVGINGVRLKSHRVIWVWMTGHFPEGKEEIDHQDGNGLHNWWRNLRLVNGQVEQQRNKRLHKNNKTGAVGVYFIERIGRYWAYVTVNRTRHSLGYFARLEDAIAARAAASAEFGFHANHGQDRPL